MASILESSCKLALTVETGTSDSGKTITANRTFNNVDPEVSDDDALSVMSKLGSLQKYNVVKMTRTDVSVLGE